MQINKVIIGFLFCAMGYAQEKEIDQKSIKVLDSVIINNNYNANEKMLDVQDNAIFSGKKTDVVRLSNLEANLVTNNSRQVFSKVPGVSVWENEGSGIQINVGVRGLSPNRSWEFNTRQSGYDISSDVFGYPEAYYNPPLEAVSEIQIVRGGASLQFGAQFGGMLNYVLKREERLPFVFESQNTIGSYGLLSTFNAIGGKSSKWSYYIYNQSRKGNGWRENNRYEVRNSHAYIGYAFSDKSKLSFEYTNMNYSMQQPGGLTDAQFELNAQSSSRKRNWFGTPWNLGALIFDTKVNDKLSLNLKLFGLIGERNSVGNTDAITIPDAILTTTNDYKIRRVDRDLYQNIGLESRSIFNYELGKSSNNLAFGFRVYSAHTNRKQKGNGTTGSDFDLTVANNFYKTAIDFTTKNVAFFAENQFKPFKNLSITPGIRWENIQSSISGSLDATTSTPNLLKDNEISRNKLLVGLGVSYQLKKVTLYSNFSQAYRPVLFSDLTPPATSDIVDPDLKDAFGYNTDIGVKGTVFKVISFDANLFYLKYNNKTGTISKYIDETMPSLGMYQYKTNIGGATHKGIEGFVDLHISKLFNIEKQIGNLHAYASLSFIDARYDHFDLTATNAGSITINSLSGNRVENAPKYIHNFGVNWNYKQISLSVQKRITAEVFTDAQNTAAPSSNAVVGLIKDYDVYDVSGEFKFRSHYNLKAGVNNLTNTNYATRRSGGYPGPGLLPGEGRTFYFSVGIRMW